MKTWRVLGLICASLFLSLSACGGSGKSEPEEDTSVSPGRAMDAGGDAPDDDDEDVTSPDDEDGGAGASLDGCEPLGCREQGFTCGMPDDMCGGSLSCGSCKGVETCGGGGKPYQCGCTPITCESLSSERGAKVCGTISDGCGAMIECGNGCTGTDTCSGGPAANECGCTPNPDPCAGKECGSASDGCGKTVQCGANAGACSANKECTQQTCACKADTSAFCAGKCGSQQTPDGCSADCGICTGGTCTGGEGTACTSCKCPAGPEAGTQDDGTCRSNATCCMPESVASLCGTAQCGTRVNRCGLTVTCGTCSGGNVCSSDSKCESPAVAALIGKYAVRSGGFGKAGFVTRAEGLLLVDIYKDPSGKLMMYEQTCWSGAFTKKGLCTPSATETCENAVTTVLPDVSSKFLATNVELDLAGTANLPGQKAWARGVQPASQNAGGWRRGRPSYCPAGGGSADVNHPDFAPANDTRALGARKPWLGGATCRCPEEEFAAHPPCQNLSAAKQAACMLDPANLSLPYAPGGSSAAAITDCRVVDDDNDHLPGVTTKLKVEFLGTQEATIGSAAVTANIFWGAVDTSASKRHWGVSQDQVGLQSANLTCTGSALLCGTSTGDFCPAYSGQPYDQDHRVNPIEFVSLHDKAAPTGGWAGHGQPALASCNEIYARRNDGGWFAPVSWSTRYPDAALCSIDGS